MAAPGNAEMKNCYTAAYRVLNNNNNSLKKKTVVVSLIFDIVDSWCCNSELFNLMNRKRQVSGFESSTLCIDSIPVNKAKGCIFTETHPSPLS